MKKIGYITIGLIMGLALGISSSAFGADVGEKIDALVSVKLNGEKIGTGIIVRGTSYIPLRITASKLGADVSYEKGEVLLSTSQPNIIKPEGMSDVDRRRYEQVTQRITYINSRVHTLEMYLINIPKKIDEYEVRATQYRRYVENGGTQYEEFAVRFEQQIDELRKTESEYRSELESLRQELIQLESEKAELESKQTASE